MEEFLLGIIAIALIVLTAELTMVLYYTLVLLREAIIVVRKIKKLEGGLEERLSKVEDEMSLLGAKFLKTIFRVINKIIKK